MRRWARRDCILRRQRRDIVLSWHPLPLSRCSRSTRRPISRSRRRAHGCLFEVLRQPRLHECLVVEPRSRFVLVPSMLIAPPPPWRWRGNPRHACSQRLMSPLMVPAILTGLALFQIYLLSGPADPLGLVMGHTVIAALRHPCITLAVGTISPPPRGSSAALGANPYRCSSSDVAANQAWRTRASSRSSSRSTSSRSRSSSWRERVRRCRRLFNYMKFDLDGP
jgi:hypothetical protein